MSIHTTSEAGRLFVINPGTLPGEVEMNSDDGCAMALITLIYVRRKLEFEKRAGKCENSSICTVIAAPTLEADDNLNLSTITTCMTLSINKFQNIPINSCDITVKFRSR